MRAPALSHCHHFPTTITFTFPHLYVPRTDTYLPVLPDAVPFLQEILEDDDQAVETKCKDFIQHMETTFGQNIESYFV